MNKAFFVKQLEGILIEFEKIQSKSQYNDLSDVSIIEITSILTKSKTAIARIVGENSEYYKDVKINFNKPIFSEKKLKYVIGVVQALKSDLENDYLKSLSEIIQSEVFSDYLDMAEHLINEGYKDPAAVLVGSTLEVHLRELCVSNSIDIEFLNSKGKPTPKKADVMNADLAKASVYSPAYQKQVTAWLGLRNSAAHGNYLEYTKEEISLMLQGLRQFILTTK